MKLSGQCYELVSKAFSIVIDSFLHLLLLVTSNYDCGYLNKETQIVRGIFYYDFKIYIIAGNKKLNSMGDATLKNLSLPQIPNLGPAFKLFRLLLGF